MKIVGIVPARMGSSRFPGKPLFPINGRPMIEHCFERSRFYGHWDVLALATCDEEIADFGRSRGWPVIMTASTHVRALDRVAEAAPKACSGLSGSDIVVCVQGDEPLLGPDAIDAVVRPIQSDAEVEGTMLAMPIADEHVFNNPDTVKIVHDMKGNVLYTSRAPVPYCSPGKFSIEHGAKRIVGIFGFRWDFLRWFTSTPESILERLESCDSNRICDNGRRQRVAEISWRPFQSVDSPADIARAEDAMKSDPLWGRY